MKISTLIQDHPAWASQCRFCYQVSCSSFLLFTGLHILTQVLKIMAACCCFLPGCHTCFGQKSSEARGVAKPRQSQHCFCFLPGCQECSTTDAMASKSSGGLAPPDGSRVRQSSGGLAPQSSGGGLAPSDTGFKDDVNVLACCCFSVQCTICCPNVDSDAPSDRRVKRRVQEDLDEDSEELDYDGEVHDVLLHVPATPNTTAMFLIGQCDHAKWDFWHIWSGPTDKLGQEVAALGLKTGPGIDSLPGNLPQRLRLDLRKAADKEFLWQLYKEARPKWVHSGPVCTFWTNLGRCTAKRTPEEWTNMHIEHCGHWTIANMLCLAQEQHERCASLEQPPGCGSWKKRRSRFLLSKKGWCLHVFPSCPFNHRDPGNGKLYYKLQGFAANRDLSYLIKPCVCPPRSHQVVEGTVQGGEYHGWRRSTISGAYPMELCAALAKIIAHTTGGMTP